MPRSVKLYMQSLRHKVHLWSILYNGNPGQFSLLVIAAKFWAQYHRPIAIHCKITFVLSYADPNRAVRNSKIRSFATLPYLDMMLLDSVLLLLTENEKFTTGVL